MKILVINCGSSTLKFQVIEIGEHKENRIARGIVEKIGNESYVNFSYGKDPWLQEKGNITNHAEAAGVVLRWLESIALLRSIRSRDMRELLETESLGDARAALSVEMFCYRVRKQIGAYLSVLGGADAVIFGGGIGENSPEVRYRICAGMEWAGLVLDKERNNLAIGKDGSIDSDSSKLHAYVISVDEELIIARDTVRCLTGF